MTDLTPDVLEAVELLAMLGLRNREDVAAIGRLRRESWNVLLRDGTYEIRWADGTALCTIPADDVAWAVAILRARRGDPLPALVN